MNPDKIFEKAVNAGDKMADCQEAASNLEDAKDSLKAAIINEYIQDGKSATEAVNTAKKDQRWKEMAQAASKAHKEYIKAKIRYEQVCNWIDNTRTEEVTRRKLTTGG